MRRLSHVASIARRSRLYATLFQIEAQLARLLSIAKMVMSRNRWIQSMTKSTHERKRTGVQVLSPTSRLSVQYLLHAVDEVGVMCITTNPSHSVRVISSGSFKCDRL